MKSYFLKIVCLALFSLTFAGISSGQTTICFDLTITDNCDGTWNGYYAIKAEVYFDDELQCSNIWYNKTATESNLSFSCIDLPYDTQNARYEIKIEASRQELPIKCQGHGSTGAVYWADVTDCDTMIYVTLE